MACVEIGQLDLQWIIENQEGFLHAVRREAARNEAREKLTAQALEPCLASIDILAFDMNAKKVSKENLNATQLAKYRHETRKIAKQVHDSGFTRFILDQFTKVYPHKRWAKGWPRKRGLLTKKIVTHLQDAVGQFARLFLRIKSAARGTFYANIPVSVYIGLIAVLISENEARQISWWDNDQNERKVIGATYKIYPEPISEEQKSILKAGCKLLMYPLTATLASVENETNILQASSMYTEYATKWTEQLGTTDNALETCVVTYFTEEEDAEYINHLTKICPPFARIAQVHAKTQILHLDVRNTVNCNDPAIKTHTDLLDFTAFNTDQDTAESSFLPYMIVTQAAPVLAGIIDMVNAFETDGAFKNAVRKLGGVEQEQALFIDSYSAKIAEVMRLGHLMHDYGRRFAEILNKSGMNKEFFPRMNAEDNYAVIHARELAKMQGEEVMDSDEDGLGMFNEEENEDLE